MLGISKNTIHIIVLSFWLFALTAPTIITLIDYDSSIVVNNINEEEQQEQHQCKKNSEKEKIIDCDFSYLLFISDKKNISYINKTSLEFSMHTSKIILPPPEMPVI
ncbi:hypothetical protein H0I23_13385 [Cellulophaga sp. HaHaR_3_176]|uniref:hypothetical protein n=1 Tax=Cellulophaga sp. HaHaR_3_176 TaxID=1942464 RepID=UPI001C1F7629|nr:hypothetical protein [Cellulophaga sp. HaHaR_3_176]QWX83438.1 hypothetical protein H0I23_13385 [Cellulophaga sp. HaHaR_3_176]